VLLPLTLVTGFYGMNVDALPFAHHGVASVLFTLAVMVVVGGALIWYFRLKKWL
jgi:Mg2+ and Co2+ transporter CorA